MVYGGGGGWRAILGTNVHLNSKLLIFQQVVRALVLVSWEHWYAVVKTLVCKSLTVTPSGPITLREKEH